MTTPSLWADLQGYLQILDAARHKPRLLHKLPKYLSWAAHALGLWVTRHAD